VAWLLLLALLGFLMVSTWRYHSFKGISFSKAYSPLIVILVGGFIYGLWNYAQLCFSPGHGLRGQRHCDPHWRHHTAPLERPAPPVPEIKIA
jgi:uncharacterized membrane protein YedE/YeeE